MRASSIDIRLVPLAISSWLCTWGALNRAPLLLCAGICIAFLFPMLLLPRGFQGLGKERVRGCAPLLIVTICLCCTCIVSSSSRATSWENEANQLCAHGKDLRDASFVLLGEVREGRNTTNKRNQPSYYVRARFLGGKENLSFLLVSTRESLRALRRGDRVLTSGTCDLNWAHAIPNVGALRINTWERIPSNDRWTRISQGVRRNLEKIVVTLPEHARALIPGMSLGDDHQASAQMRDDMKTVSFAHLTAVSGTHMAILMMTVGLLTTKKRRIAIITQVSVLLIFLGLVGPASSVLRSFAVSAIGFVGMWSNREGGIYSSLSTVIILACLISPYDACALGFTLSVLATWGVSVPARWIETGVTHVGSIPQSVQSGIEWSAKLISVPLGAQLATLPIMLSMNSWVSPWAIPAQLLIAPLVTPVTVGCFISALAAQIWPALGYVCAWLTSWGTGWISIVASRLSALPGARISVGEWSGLITAVILFLLIWVVRVKIRRFSS